MNGTHHIQFIWKEGTRISCSSISTTFHAVSDLGRIKLHRIRFKQSWLLIEIENCMMQLLHMIQIWKKYTVHALYRIVIVPYVPGTSSSIVATPRIIHNDRGECCNLLAHLDHL